MKEYFSKIIKIAFVSQFFINFEDGNMRDIQSTENP